MAIRGLAPCPVSAGEVRPPLPWFRFPGFEAPKVEATAAARAAEVQRSVRHEISAQRGEVRRMTRRSDALLQGAGAIVASIQQLADASKEGH